MALLLLLLLVGVFRSRGRWRSGVLLHARAFGLCGQEGEGGRSVLSLRSGGARFFSSSCFFPFRPFSTPSYRHSRFPHRSCFASSYTQYATRSAVHALLLFCESRKTGREGTSEARLCSASQTPPIPPLRTRREVVRKREQGEKQKQRAGKESEVRGTE